mmetsp:Transcript_37788/g.119003  ORF Transcript_37788/g.119003 Transcript_37788/m.119003 type:complete len:213 (+) Transcript_37788:89-727(+)
MQHRPRRSRRSGRRAARTTTAARPTGSPTSRATRSTSSRGATRLARRAGGSRSKRRPPPRPALSPRRSPTCPRASWARRLAASRWPCPTPSSAGSPALSRAASRPWRTRRACRSPRPRPPCTRATLRRAARQHPQQPARTTGGARLRPLSPSQLPRTSGAGREFLAARGDPSGAHPPDIAHLLRRLEEPTGRRATYGALLVNRVDRCVDLFG